MPELNEVLAARAGDESAYGILIARESRWVYGLALVVLGDQMEAEDAFQEACLLAWRDLPKLRDPAAWQGWFRRLATNAILEHGRRMGRRPRIIEISPDLAAGGADPARTASDNDLIMRALARLSSEERLLIGLRFGRDLTIAQSAELLRLPVGTAKARLHRALNKLRQWIEE